MLNTPTVKYSLVAKENLSFTLTFMLNDLVFLSYTLLNESQVNCDVDAVQCLAFYTEKSGCKKKADCSVK